MTDSFYAFITSPSIVLLALATTAGVVITTLTDPRRRISTSATSPEVKKEEAARGRWVIPLLFSTALGTGGLWTLASYKDDIARWTQSLGTVQTSAATPEKTKDVTAVPSASCENRRAIKMIPLVTDPPDTRPLTCLKAGESSRPIEKPSGYGFVIYGEEYFLHCRLPDGRTEWARVTTVQAPITACQSHEITFFWVQNARSTTNSITHAFQPIPR